MEGRRGVKENYGFVTFYEAKSAKGAFKRLQNFMFLDGSVLELKFWEDKNAFSKREPRHHQFTDADIAKASQPNIHQINQAGRIQGGGG